ncbi:MAG: AAA family ATPase [Nitrospinales bacterium]
MKLEFLSRYKSILQFKSIELPQFTVLTGVNGSGKTHLLEAIEKRAVAVEGIVNEHIVRFGYETFSLQKEIEISGDKFFSEKVEGWKYFQGSIRGITTKLKIKLKGEYIEALEYCKKNDINLWNVKQNKFVDRYKQSIKEHFKNNNVKSNYFAQGIYALIKSLPYSIDELLEDEFMKLFKPYTYINDFLPLQLGKVFWDYHLKYEQNKYHKYRNEIDGENNPIFTEDAFIAKYGEKPWIKINEILKNYSSLDYKVNSPEGMDRGATFLLRLIHTQESGLNVDFSDLSSGEKILMALVASVYKSASDKHFPDMLLLDEIDSSLHPSMIRNMLNVIEDVFLDQDVNVILVTHSPTTISLAPEDSIFVMNKSGVNRLEKKSKQEGLSILTEGYATIDKGLKLFDEVSKNQISVITEGNNTNFIEKAFALYNITDVNVIEGLEAISGKTELKTLFNFFSKATHENKVIFIWDCDVSFNLDITNNTFPFIFEKNEENNIATKGIENLFSEELLGDFIKSINFSDGRIKNEFDSNRKKDFEEFIIDRNCKDDFLKFQQLFDFIDTKLRNPSSETSSDF